MNFKKVLKHVLGAVWILAVVTCAHALDFPHSPTVFNNCVNCHDMSSLNAQLLRADNPHPPEDIDDTIFNNLCWSCHNGAIAPFKKTHSSLTTDNGYGNWAMECRTCHNPHSQVQTTEHGTASYLATGYSTGLTTTTLAQAGAGWAINEHAGRRVIPNTSYLGNSYDIVSNTSDTLTLGSLVDLTRAAAGNTFAIIYGKLIKHEIQTPNSGLKAVKFFRPTGNNSFADGDATRDGICEVCHTQTDHFRNDGLAPDQNHASVGGAAGVNCMTCHSHAKGFKPDCNACHGYPPVVNAPRPLDGLVANPSPTGSASAGAHALHATSDGYNFACATCHAGGMPESAVSGNNKIQIGFGSLAHNGGLPLSYDGHALNAPFSYEGTNGTTVTGNGSLTCANVYCHSDGRAPINLPVYDLSGQSPAWNGSSPDPQGDGNKCNNCHEYPPRYDAHNYHIVRGFTCDLCHSDTTRDGTTIHDKSKHVNGVFDLAPAPQFFARGAWQPLNFNYSFAEGGGTCSNNACHQYYNFEDPKTWRYREPPTEIFATSTVAQAGNCTSTIGPVNYTISLACSECLTPYEISLLSWGDGSAPQSVSVNGGYTFSHVYPPVADAVYSVQWKVRDKDGLRQNGADPRTQQIVVCPIPNTNPVPNYSIQPGSDANAYDITISDLSIDADYNQGSHALLGPGKVKIDFGDFTPVLEVDVNLTNAPSNFVIQHTYDRAAFYWITYWVKDNAGSAWIPKGAKNYKVTKTEVIPQ